MRTLGVELEQRLFEHRCPEGGAGPVVVDRGALAAEHRRGLSRWVHEKAGPLAIGFVVCATLFSLTTQAYIIGGTASSIAGQLGVAPGTLLLALAPHALPELIALFLPLAAWMIASRRGDWQDLLAATFVTVAIAVPVLLAAAAVGLVACGGDAEAFAMLAQIGEPDG